MNPSPDSLTLLLLCSHLAVPEGATPLSLREWNHLARQLQALDLRPSHLLAMSPSEFPVQLQITEDEARRLAALSGRVRFLQAELDRLAGRGIHPITRVDPRYPERYRQRLKESAPVVLFYAGNDELLGQPGIAVVGSRHLDEAGKDSAAFVGNACGLSGLVLYSGGARGVDTISMQAALEARGTAVAVLADSLEKAIPNHKAALERGDLCLLTPYSPTAGFSVGAAMGRNRLIYTLADYALVVASDAGTGGTWSGATEALKAGWLPVFVLDHAAMPDGNRQLIDRGALKFPHPFPQHHLKLRQWLDAQALPSKQDPIQPELF